MENSSDGDVTYSSLFSLTHGAVVAIVGITAEQLLRFFTNWLLTQGLGPVAFGVFSFGKRVILTVRGFTNLGADVAILRFIPKYDDDPARQNRVLGFAYVTVLTINLLGAATLYTYAPEINALTLDESEFTDVFRVFAILLPFESFVFFFSNYFRSLELVEYQTYLLHVVRPVAWLVGVVIAFGLGFSGVGIVASIVLMMSAVFAGALVLSLVRTSPRPSFDLSGDEAVEFYNYSLPVTVSRVGMILSGRVDVLLIGFLLTATDAGVYEIVLLVTGLIRIPLLSFNQLLPSIASKLYSNDDYETLNLVYSTITRWIITLALFVGGAQLVYRNEVLGLFGAEYVRGTEILVLFVFSRLIGSAVGSTEWLLRMTDHQYLSAFNFWVLGVLNLGLSYYFILEYGLIGAALGTAGSYALSNIVRLLELWYLEDLFPFTWKYLKPLAAAVGATAAMFGLGLYVSGVESLVVGVLTGAIVYSALLLGFGVESEDRQFVSRIIDQYRSAT